MTAVGARRIKDGVVVTVVELVDGGMYVIGAERNERRRRVTRFIPDDEPGWSRHEPLTDPDAANPFGIVGRDEVIVEVARDVDVGKRGGVYGPRPEFPHLLRVHVAGDVDGQREFVHAPLSALRPVTDRTPDPQPPPLAPLAEMPREQRIVAALVRARDEGR